MRVSICILLILYFVVHKRGGRGCGAGWGSLRFDNGVQQNLERVREEDERLVVARERYSFFDLACG